MSDVALEFLDAGYGDLVLRPQGDLETDDGLRSAVLLSLFTDARVDQAELPFGETDQRGFWGDAVFEDSLPLGSKLWLLDREKMTTETLARAIDYAKQALDWLIADGVASEVLVTGELTGGQRLVLSISIQRPSGATIEFKFNTTWDAEGAR